LLQAAERIGGMLALMLEVRRVGRASVKARMRATTIAQVEVAPDRITRRADAVVAVQVYL
jgi:hypothetical protein